MDCCTTRLVLLLVFVQHFETSFGDKILLKNTSATDNSIPYNISGLTNKTLNDGIGFSCKVTRPLDLVLSVVAGVFIISGIVLLTVGELFILLQNFTS